VSVDFRIMVVCEQKIYIFNFVTFQNIETLETHENPKGICAVSNDPKVTVMAYPDKQTGYIRVKAYGMMDDLNIDNTFETTQIKAHESSIACLAINNEGTLIASASDKVIGLFSQ
jgi:WD40 repeat protein